MNRDLIYRLLKIIKFNGNIWEFVGQGYQFGQIALFFDKLKLENYIEFTDDKIVVSSLGEVFIQDFEAENKNKKCSKLILSRSEMWSKPIGIFSIYIPKKKSYVVLK